MAPQVSRQSPWLLQGSEYLSRGSHLGVADCCPLSHFTCRGCESWTRTGYGQYFLTRPHPPRLRFLQGNLGGGLATIICDYFQFEDHESKNLIVLTGMSGAMGALFPTPLLGVLMIHELGNPPKGFMESTLLMSVSAIMAFIVFYQLEQKTWLERLTPNYTLSALWEFDLWHCSTAVVIGLVASGCSLGILLSIGIVKQILFRIQEKCDKTMILNGQMVISTLGGLVIGTLHTSSLLTVSS